MTYNAAMKSADMLLPDELVDGTKNGLTACKDVGMYS